VVNPAIGLLATDAVEGDTSASLTGYGLGDWPCAARTLLVAERDRPTPRLASPSYGICQRVPVAARCPGTADPRVGASTVDASLTAGRD
jgi:hypothetical protein